MKKTINSTRDEERKEIRRKKIEEMLKRVIQPLNNKPIILTDNNFSNEITKHKLIVVDFWAPWCGPCKMISPTIEQLAAEYAGKVTFGKMNVDDNQEIPHRFGVQGIPTLLIIKKGKVIDKIIGVSQKSQIEAKIKPHIY